MNKPLYLIMNFASTQTEGDLHKNIRQYQIEWKREGKIRLQLTSFDAVDTVIQFFPSSCCFMN
jgi:hypothetical protein